MHQLHQLPFLIILLFFANSAAYEFCYPEIALKFPHLYFCRICIQLGSSII